MPITQPAATDAISCGPVWISPVEMAELRVRGERVPLSVMQLAILASLIQAQGRILTREELYKLATNGTLDASRIIDVHISRIRRALGDFGRHIIAVHRRGYRIDVVGLSGAA